MGAGKQQPLIQAVDDLELETSGIGAMAAVQARLARRRLPTISNDGLVEYAQLAPSSAVSSASSSNRRISTGGQGSDVDWVEYGASGAGITFRGNADDAGLQLQQQASDLSTRSAQGATPRRHLSASKSLSKMPWEKEAEEVRGSRLVAWAADLRWFFFFLYFDLFFDDRCHFAAFIFAV
jgi:hypothetical protein